MRTSHVGSFPLSYSRENVDRIMKDLWSIGIDVPPYPQLRSFIDIYLQPLLNEGIIYSKNGFYYIKFNQIDRIHKIKPKISEAEDAINAMIKYNLLFKWLRAPITGPFTLASRIYVDDLSKSLYATLLSKKDFIMDALAPYIRSFIEYLVDLGYNVLFLDEPILGVIVGKKRIILGYNEEYIIDTINYILKGISVEKGIHVCGRISDKLFKILAKIDSLDILNFEFYDTRENLEIIDHKVLEKNDKLLAPGIVSAKNPSIEGLDEIKKLLEKIYRIANGRIDLVSGDCGFAGLRNALDNPLDSYRISIEKLRRIVAIVQELAI
ncbi:MAG: methionine synthase [Thermoprotei archaeon]|nr:MAG: methionine synthase [Thermoprotei archaeon]